MRMLALGGVAGPGIFIAVTLVAASLRPDYSHLANLISELGATGTPYGAFMNYAGFVPAGLLIAAFGVALARALPRQRFATAAAVLVMVFGCGMVASGIFSCDAGCPQGASSLENRIHDTIAPMIFLCLIAGVILLGVHLRRSARRDHLGAYSLVTGACALLFMIALVSSLDTRTMSGLWQRLMLATLFLWCALVGVDTYRTLAAQPGRAVDVTMRNAG